MANILRNLKGLFITVFVEGGFGVYGEVANVASDVLTLKVGGTTAYIAINQILGFF